jgi:hypothetical protein
MLRLACGDYAHVLSHFAHEAMGAAEAPGVACALCFRGFLRTRLGRRQRRGNAQLCLVMSLRAQRSNPEPRATLWIASSLALLAMTTSYRLFDI